MLIRASVQWMQGCGVMQIVLLSVVILHFQQLEQLIPITIINIVLKIRKETINSAS